MPFSPWEEVRLERDPPEQLHGTALDCKAVDHTDVRIGQCVIRRVEAWVVNDVLGGGANFYADPFPRDMEGFTDGGIYEEISRPI